MEARAEERFGPWRVVRRIAAGALAEVVEARRVGIQLGPPVALKRLHVHLSRDPAISALFAAECDLVVRGLAPHPHLVRGVEAGAVDDRPFLAMALVAGRDLRQIVDGGARLSLPAAVQAVLDLCAALAYLRERHWVHGDVNPANLVVDRERGLVVLCDLGVARRIGAAGPSRGTHAYMAPEQVRGEPWTAATDVFAVGVVLWELVTGARLFFRGASYLTMAAVIEQPAPALLDPALDAIAQAALAKRAEARCEIADLATGLAELATARGWEPEAARAELAALAG